MHSPENINAQLSVSISISQSINQKSITFWRAVDRGRKWRVGNYRQTKNLYTVPYFCLLKGKLKDDLQGNYITEVKGEEEIV